MKVELLVPPLEGEYPHDALARGLERAGFSITKEWMNGDVLVTWSPWLGSYRGTAADHYRRARRPVIVIENGWLSPIHDVPFYQIAFDGWNGMGRYVPGDGARWRDWLVKLKPWTLDRTGTALIIGQRGHPEDRRTAPPRWHENVNIDWPSHLIVRRPRDCGVSLGVHLTGASVCHVWTSNAASHALVAGVPVVRHGPNLMTHELASGPGTPFLCRGDREPVFERLAWAQWYEDEIRRGDPFRRLLGHLERAA